MDEDLSERPLVQRRRSREEGDEDEVKRPSRRVQYEHDVANRMFHNTIGTPDILSVVADHSRSADDLCALALTTKSMRRSIMLVYDKWKHARDPSKLP